MFEQINEQLASDPVTLPYSRSQAVAHEGVFTLLCHKGTLAITFSGQLNLEGVYLLLLDERRRCISYGLYKQGKAMLTVPKERDGYILQIKEVIPSPKQREGKQPIQRSRTPRNAKQETRTRSRTSDGRTTQARLFSEEEYPA